MQSHWGLICSRKLYLTFGNLTSISINASTFAKTNNKRQKYETDENSFGKVLPYIKTNLKQDCNNNLEKLCCNFAFQLVDLSE